VPDAHSWIFAAIGVLFISLSKAGFGDGLASAPSTNHHDTNK
jgi:hypothetical protein